MARKKKSAAVSSEDRMRIVIAFEAGETARYIADKMKKKGVNIHYSTASRIWANYKKRNGSVAMAKSPGRPSIKISDQLLRNAGRIALKSRRLSRRQLCTEVGVYLTLSVISGAFLRGAGRVQVIPRVRC